MPIFLLYTVVVEEQSYKRRNHATPESQCVHIIYKPDSICFHSHISPNKNKQVQNSGKSLNSIVQWHGTKADDLLSNWLREIKEVVICQLISLLLQCLRRYDLFSPSKLHLMVDLMPGNSIFLHRGSVLELGHYVCFDSFLGPITGSRTSGNFAISASAGSPTTNR